MAVATPPVDDVMAQTDSERRLGGVPLVALAVLSLLPALFAPFVADDYYHVVAATQLGEALTRSWVLPIHLGGAWWTPHDLSVEYFRPLIVLSFAVDRLFYGWHAIGYHLTNLGLHALATLLAWSIARRILGEGFAAWSAAALFAVHPCHVQAVGWISGRTDLLAALFYMAALLAYFQSRERPGSRVQFALLSVALFIAALMAKEMAITFPAVVFAHGLLRPDGEPPAKRALVPVLTTVAAALYLVLRATMLGGLHPPPTPFAYHLGDPGLLRHLLTVPLLYLGDFTGFVPPDPVVTVPFWEAHPILFGLFATSAVLTFQRSLRHVRERALAVWGLVWIGFTLLPVLMLPPGEHFLYLPSLGYCIIAGAQVPNSWEEIDFIARRVLSVIGWVVIVVCFGRTIYFGVVERKSLRTVEEAAAALDRSPDANLLLVADLPTGASLAFELAVDFARGRDVEVGILSILPSLSAGGETRSTLTVAPPDRLLLSRDEGFLHSYVERALAGSRSSFAKGETFERHGYTVTVQDAPGGQLRAFETRVTDPAHTLVLRESEEGLVPVALGADAKPPPVGQRSPEPPP
jgi:hypothetical protein